MDTPPAAKLKKKLTLLCKRKNSTDFLKFLFWVKGFKTTNRLTEKGGGGERGEGGEEGEGEGTERSLGLLIVYFASQSFLTEAEL